MGLFLQDLTQELLKLSVLYTALELSDKARPLGGGLVACTAWRLSCGMHGLAVEMPGKAQWQLGCCDTPVILHP